MRKKNEEFSPGGPTSHWQEFQKDTEHRDKNVIKETIQGNFPEEYKALHVNDKRLTLRHIIEKFQNITGKEKILKSFREKLWRMALDFSTTLEVIKQWSNILRILRKSYFQS